MTRARSLRKRQTDAEKYLWRSLRASQLGVRFRRQHELAGCIVDFICLERRLVIELDGGRHADKSDYDERRSRILASLGFRVIRFWNNDVLQRTDDVLSAIHAALSELLPPHPNPLPRRRRGRGRSEKAADKNSPLPQVPLGGEGWLRGQHNNLHDAVGSKTNAIRLRAKLYGLIRTFFAERGVVEVETPILSAAANTDPNIRSFTTRFSGRADAGDARRWLRTSSEFAQKRLLMDGIGDNYELGRVFRDGESGHRHNPEFTMLEWYRVGWDHRRLMAEVVELIRAALALVECHADRFALSYRELFQTSIDIDPFVATSAQLREALGDVRVDPNDLSRDDWLDLLLTHRIQPAFPADRITVVYDYPATQCALAKIRADDPPVAERFEVYLGSYELANGYHELTDPAEQRARFEHDNAQRRSRGEREMPIDVNLLAALDQGMPDCAGVALGIERLLMAMTGSDDIRDVLAVAFAQA